MKKRITLALTFIGSLSFAQVGINTENPHESSLLDVLANDRGILIPRLTTGYPNEISRVRKGI